MRLITHNLLRCNIRGLTAEQGYPLKIEASKTEIVAAQFSPDFIKAMLRKINWSALKSAAESLSVGELIKKVETLDPDSASNDEELLKEIHHVLFEIQLKDGWLVCPTTGRKFPVKDGIPNMLLHEDEV